MKKTYSIPVVALWAVAPISHLGCGDINEEDPTVIADALEVVNGDLDMGDEAPMFGEEDRFAEEDLDQPEAEVEDPMASDVADMEARDGAVVYNVLVAWGQADFTRDFERIREWSGELEITRGGIVATRAIRFEGRDRILPRDNLRIVAFHSVTGPHHDGLRLRVVDTEPNSDEPLELIYRMDGAEHRIELDALLDGPVSRDVDDVGNRIVAVAHRRRFDACDQGFMRGRWRKVAPNHGILLGQISNAEGELRGHMKGIFGERRNGEKVFFGKVVNGSGEFLGLYAGKYRSGHFAGRWITRAGEKGVLGGAYRESDRVRGGHYVGRWAEKTCDTRMSGDL